MKLNFQKTIAEQQEGAVKTAAINWSPNGKKLAVVSADRTVLLFDENGSQRDKFATKPFDAKYGKKSYYLTSAAFSPDSTRLAIGQSDNAVFVYRLGQAWNEKKVICNKFAQPSSVTTLTWPKEDRLILGLSDGKVRSASCKNNKCSTLYNTDAFVTQISTNPSKNRFISGHIDGSIISYSFETKRQTKILNHPCSPYVLVFMANGIIAAGSDRRIIWYSDTGKLLQQFDYGSDEFEKDFYTAVADPYGQKAIIGSYNRLRLFTWNTHRGALEEGTKLEIPNLYTITALCWKYDGSCIVVGTICGLVIILECCLKKSLIRNQFEIIYVSQSHILIRDISTNQKTNMNSESGYTIDDVKILGSNRYAVGYTSETLIIVDVAGHRSSEVAWQSARNEKFIFNNKDICIIANAGELSFVEYGYNEILGWVRTEFISPHLLSVVMTRQNQKNGTSIKLVAYLLDANSIAVVNLTTGFVVYQTTHSSAIDWLEISEAATKLLFRDQKSDLTMVDLQTKKNTTLINYCNYVQWVPNSEVIVAQSGEQLCIWYQLENPDQLTMIPVKGDIETVIRDELHTEVIVQEPNARVAYELDQILIEFETALRNCDYGRALDFLENRHEADTYVLWRQLGHVSWSQNQLLVAQRCYAALGDIPRVLMIAETLQLTNGISKITPDDPMLNYKVRAKMALMNRNFKEAEQIYLETNNVNEVLEIYQLLHKWDEAIEVAKLKSNAEYQTLKVKYNQYLLETNQYEKAAEICEANGDYIGAIHLYTKENYIGQAARILLSSTELISRNDLVEEIIERLIQNGLFEKAGDLLEKRQEYERCLNCYEKAQCYNKALQLSRIRFPEKVITIEEAWGDLLMSEGKYDAAISHFLESGKTAKALEAATYAKQWDKAAQIADALEDSSVSKKYYGRIAEHYANTGDLDRAEMFYVEAGQHRDAIEMYNKASRWKDAYRLATEFLGEKDTNEAYGSLALKMEIENEFEVAAKIYESLGQIGKAIEMYKKANKFEQVITIVKKYHPERLLDIYKEIGNALENSGDLKGAENYYLKTGDWQSAVNMYRNAEKWSEAYRISKQQGNETAQKRVAFLWAKSLGGGDAAVKLLEKLNYVQEMINYACQNKAFDFAYEICRIGDQSKLPFVHLQNAIQLEEDGNSEEAEEHYIKGNSPKEAVLMYIHLQQWDEAERVAKVHCTEMLEQLFMEKAKIALQNQDYAAAESCLLRANRPDTILQHYKEKHMWREALRIAKDYVPSSLYQIQEEYDEVQLRSGAKGAFSYIAQGEEWEAQGEYNKAIECYLRVNETSTNDTETVANVMIRAGELITKFLPAKEAREEGKIVIERLLRCNRFDEAAELSLRTNCPENAVNSYIAAQNWAKAKKVAREFAPEMEEDVDVKYKESLRRSGKIGELIDVDTVAALDLLIEQGLWEKALETAKQKSHPPLLDKYLALYATELINSGRFLEAIKAFERYGPSSNPNNFNLYKLLFEQIYMESNAILPNSYKRWAHLRNMLYSLCINFSSSNESRCGEKEIFERYLEVAHYKAIWNALSQSPNSFMQTIRQQICVSLLRYTDIINTEKAFYEAGEAYKEHGKEKETLAFVFLNHFLDIYDAIDQQDPSSIDTAIFNGSEIPQEVPLPDKHIISKDVYEETKEWVLAVSVEIDVDETVFTNQDEPFEGNLITSSGIRQQQCIISGYVAGNNAKVFGSSGKVAGRENWNHLVVEQKTRPTEYLEDILQFISRWTATPFSLSV